MSIEQWTEQLLTGHPKVDQQHRHLFSMMEHLYQLAVTKGAQDQLTQAFEALGRYVITHFEDEENLMRQCNYPHLNHHSSLHRVLEQKTNSYLNLFHQGKQVNLEELVEFCAKWIKNHVLIEDMKIVSWMKESSWQELPKPRD